MQPAPGLPKGRRVAVRSSARSSCSIKAGNTGDTGTREHGEGRGDGADYGARDESLSLPRPLSAGEAPGPLGLRILSSPASRLSDPPPLGPRSARSLLGKGAVRPGALGKNPGLKEGGRGEEEGHRSGGGALPMGPVSVPGQLQMGSTYWGGSRASRT